MQQQQQQQQQQCSATMLQSMTSACAGYSSVTGTVICGTGCEVAAAAMVSTGCTLPDQQLDADVHTAVRTCRARYAVGPSGCSGSFTTITDMGVCETAKAVLEPDMGGVQAGGFGNEWADGCFFNRGTV